ncbi:DUF86 domain-containing protein [Photorhabdus luminescens]|uniref:DUF86 domain-containing protein n=1 Tax=Photorhabdus akhurstii TaxID=171438 RepID=A0ABX8LTX9_9GAMM|nr:MULTISPECIES: DUF86 domain-containing protein [Photorhabdus]KGM28926.1 hypothetical protein KS18_03865 [Photorhabdus luminescens]MBS9426663.1 DUF86 domain-containing protein [Photorhabdus akhurstii]MCC8456799.1 DUF86 domain-containing protein [Photorhabdus aegyptia]PQQ41963.1 DUF86 domain-containing protein [Photorhabdus luminescens]QXF33160.1 DUF86 domain-containing protein [Photorhabdus akhurstii]
MSRDQQRLVDYLAHILEAIKRIDSYTEDMDELAFLNNRLVQDAVIRNFEIIGEASNNIGKHYPDFAIANPELPLSFAYQMRNALAHGYFKVDLEIVWKTIHSALPGLYQQILELMPKDSHEISFD